MKSTLLRLLPLCFALALAACGDDTAECPDTNTTCSGQCTNLDLDRLNCGACGNVCSAGFECVEGACSACPGGNCPEGNLYAACFGEGTVVQLEKETDAPVGGKASGIDGPQSLALLGTNTLLALGSMDQTLYVIDRATMETIGSIVVGSAPNQVLVRGTRAYVVNSTENTVQVIDLTKATAPVTVDEVSLGEGKSPSAGAFDAAGTLWVSAWLTGEVIPVDFSGSRGVVGTPVVLEATGVEGSPYPGGVAVVGDVVYVALNNLGADFGPAGNGRLSSVHRTTGEKALIDLGATCTNPGFLAVSGAEIYVACTGAYAADNGEVAIFDTVAGEVARRVATGGGPSRLALDPTRPGHFYAADAASGSFFSVDGEGNSTPVAICPNVGFEFNSDVLVAP